MIGVGTFYDRTTAGTAAEATNGAATGGGEAEGEAVEDGAAGGAAKLRSGPYENDLEYLHDMFALAKLRSDVARVRRHMEERGQAVASSSGGGGGGADGGDADSDDADLPLLDEPYVRTGRWTSIVTRWRRCPGAASAATCGTRPRRTKQARHDSKRARKLQARAEKLQERICRIHRLAHGDMPA